jgi:hypothetical protein
VTVKRRRRKGYVVLPACHEAVDAIVGDDIGERAPHLVGRETRKRVDKMKSFGVSAIEQARDTVAS